MRFVVRGCLGLVVGFVVLLAGVFTLGFLQHGYTDPSADFRDSSMLHSPSPWREPVTLRIATFNIQDLYLVATNHRERMAVIGEYLGPLDPDIVGFQEAFIDAHRPILIDSLVQHTRLKYFRYFSSASMGAGLLTASAFPLVENEQFFHQYTVSGQWYKIYQGDWFAGKGVGLARVELPGGKGFFDFYNTHAQAGYGNPYYKVVREQQMRECGEFMNASRARNVPAFLVGDLNCRRGDPDYETLVRTGNLVRLMIADSTIDNIMGVNDPGYGFEVLETITIPRRIDRNGARFTLSDHNGYLSIVRVTPVASPVAAPAGS
jgi:sphingomyelin phosphodiesterase 2